MLATPTTSDVSRRGFSFMEVVVAISIISILSALAITGYTGYTSETQATVATDVLEMVNSAVHRFNEGNYELSVTPVSNATTAEMAVVRTLQYRNPVYPKVGSPYITPRWSPVASSSTTDYRLQWTGKLFTLLTPGTSGTGLKVDMGAMDLGTSYTFPANYVTAGHP